MAWNFKIVSWIITELPNNDCHFAPKVQLTRSARQINVIVWKKVMDEQNQPASLIHILDSIYYTDNYPCIYSLENVSRSFFWG